MEAMDDVGVIQQLLDAGHINENDNFDAETKPGVKVELKNWWDEVASVVVVKEPQCHINPNKDWFDRIYDQHNEQGRHYHTAVHLQEMLGYLQILREADVITQEQYAPMVWATFFHDLVYDPKSNTNEKDSAKEWISFCGDFNMSESLAQTVNTMILATEKHQLLPMIDPDMALSQAYFLDLDMAVLGKTQGAYMAYAYLIRKEYSFVAHDVYCSKRAEILQKFLETTIIYQTTIFRKAIEKRARANLQAEIELLQQGIIPAGSDEVQGTFHVWDALLDAVSTMNLPLTTTGRTLNRTTAVAVTVLLTILLSTFLNHHVVDASTVTALSSSRRSLPSSQRRTSAASHNHNHHHHANCDGRPHIPVTRHACGLFLWDAPSALLYKWCNYLLKDHIYEGRGGYLFVRYESNSILQLLYPCTRYAPNKCLFCGGSFPDHLLLWWSKKHLYSPFDQYLDKTYNDALTLLSFETTATKDSSTTSKRTTRSSSIGRSSYQKKKNFPPPPQVMEEAPTFQFHKRYVEDVTHLAEIDETPKLQWLDIKRRINNNNNNNDPKNKMALKVGYVPAASMVYVAEIPESSLPTKGGGPPRSFQTMVGNFVAGIALNAVEDLIELQHRENKKRQQQDAYKRSRSSFWS